jgi:hypothetical protein
MPRDTSTPYPGSPPGAEAGSVSIGCRHDRPRLALPEVWDPARRPAKAVAEEGVRLAYAAAGLGAPRILWCKGPLQLAEVWARTISNRQPGANVKGALFDQPLLEAKRRIESLAPWKASPALYLLAHDRSRVTGIDITAAVSEAVGGTRPRLLPWIWHARGRLPRSTRRPDLAASGCGPDALTGAVLAPYIDEGLTGTTSDILHALRLIGENIGWIVPHERVCWLVERPDVVGTDATGRLHCASGSALRYGDGWSVHAWKGVAVPAWVIARPHDITLDWIDAQIDAPVRHAMIDIFTAERFIAAGGADPVARDCYGTLWSRVWTHRATVIDAWSAVEYAGVASKRMFEPVPARMRSPREALDWLLGPSSPERVRCR